MTTVTAMVVVTKRCKTNVSFYPLSLLPTPHCLHHPPIPRPCSTPPCPPARLPVPTTLPFRIHYLDCCCCCCCCYSPTNYSPSRTPLPSLRDHPSPSLIAAWRSSYPDAFDGTSFPSFSHASPPYDVAPSHDLFPPPAASSSYSYLSSWWSWTTNQSAQSF